MVIDEAHAITQGAVDLLLPFLEALPKHFVVIFTTTRAVDQGLFGDDCGPFASRTIRVKLTNQGLGKAFAQRAKAIAQREDLDGKPIEAYERMVRDCKNNMRAAFNDAAHKRVSTKLHKATQYLLTTSESRLVSYSIMSHRY